MVVLKCELLSRRLPFTLEDRAFIKFDDEVGVRSTDNRTSRRNTIIATSLYLYSFHQRFINMRAIYNLKFSV